MSARGISCTNPQITVIHCCVTTWNVYCTRIIFMSATCSQSEVHQPRLKPINPWYNPGTTYSGNRSGNISKGQSRVDISVQVHFSFAYEVKSLNSNISTFLERFGNVELKWNFENYAFLLLLFIFLRTKWFSVLESYKLPCDCLMFHSEGAVEECEEMPQLKALWTLNNISIILEYYNNWTVNVSIYDLQVPL